MHCMKKRKLAYEVVKKIDIHRLGVRKAHSFDVVKLKKGAYYPPHLHKKSRTMCYVMEGSGRIIIGNKVKPYKKGSIFHVSKAIKYGFKPKTTTFFLSIQVPPIKNQRTGKEVIWF